MDKNKLFCNNCGKYNHSFSNCIEPITSIGVICVKYNQTKGEYEYLLICRKDTLGFIEFMRGKYGFSNKSHIQHIVNEMTNEEKNKIQTMTFDELWANIWHNNYGNKYKNERHASESKYDLLKNGVTIHKERLTLKDFVDASTTHWTEPEWEIPKGRRNYRERDIDTALREFEEETGISRSSIDIISNVIPFDEIFTGSNFKSYRHRYFIALLKNNVTLDNFQKCEVSKIDWIPFSNLKDVIRNYSLEKIEILKKVNKLLETYRIIF